MESLELISYSPGVGFPRLNVIGQKGWCHCDVINNHRYKHQKSQKYKKHKKHKKPEKPEKHKNPRTCFSCFSSFLCFSCFSGFLCFSCFSGFYYVKVSSISLKEALPHSHPLCRYKSGLFLTGISPYLEGNLVRKNISNLRGYSDKLREPLGIGKDVDVQYLRKAIKVGLFKHPAFFFGCFYDQQNSYKVVAQKQHR